jgi:predicted transcriptional regulator
MESHSLTIQADPQLVTALKKIAKRKHTSLENVAKEALLSYVQLQPAAKKKYSIIGIARSGKGNLSVEAENILEKSANRREGRSLPE